MTFDDIQGLLYNFFYCHIIHLNHCNLDMHKIKFQGGDVCWNILWDILDVLLHSNNKYNMQLIVVNDEHVE
jgi:hypothetical protein